MKEPINRRDSEGRKHGVWEYHYTDGTLWWKRYFLHGELHGVWAEYYRDGALSWESHWHHGKAHGLHQRYNTDGTLYKKRYHITIK